MRSRIGGRELDGLTTVRKSPTFAGTKTKILSAVRGNPTIGGMKLVGLTAFRESRSEYKHRPPSLLDLMTHNTKASRLTLSGRSLGSYSAVRQSTCTRAMAPLAG